MERIAFFLLLVLGLSSTALGKTFFSNSKNSAMILRKRTFFLDHAMFGKD